MKLAKLVNAPLNVGFNKQVVKYTIVQIYITEFCL